MSQATLFLGCVLLSSVTALPRNTQNGGLPSQPAVPEAEPTPNVFSSQIPLPAPGTCRDLLYVGPSIVPLSEYLSLLALTVVLEDMGCPAEARYLQLQLSKEGGRDKTNTLVLKSLKRIREEGIGDNKVLLRGLGPFPGDLKRVQRSALPEACTSDEGEVMYYTAKVLLEFADKLPSTDLVKEFKASAVNVTQQCTFESWEHLYEVGNRLMKSPEVENATLSIADHVYFITRLAVLMKRVFVGLLWKYFQAYLG